MGADQSKVALTHLEMVHFRRSGLQTALKTQADGVSEINWVIPTRADSIGNCCNACHSERSEESLKKRASSRRFFTPLRSVQNDKYHLIIFSSFIGLLLQKQLVATNRSGRWSPMCRDRHDVESPGRSSTIAFVAYRRRSRGS